ncbi:MAG: hypothetical protein IJ813_02800 [Bacteroidales bacterium]|nr:hypothetical protein [Bacteroidales bacterium]
MKKTLSILGAAALVALVAACTRFPDEGTTKDLSAPAAPVVTIDRQTETSVAFTVAPAAGTGYYSYALLSGAKKSVNANSLLAVNLGGIAEDIANYATDTSVSDGADKLSRNATYTIYAVAASVNGVLSEVTAVEFTTGDTAIPESASASTSGNVIQLSFSEPVTLVEGKEATASYFAENQSLEEPVGPANVVTEVSGNTVTFTVTLDGENPLPAGALFNVEYPEGLFVDALGNKVEALESPFFLDDKGEIDNEGLGGKIANEDFDLKIYNDEVVEVVSNLQNPIWIAVPEDFIYFKYDNSLIGSIVYEYVSAGVKTVTTYDFSGFPNYGWNGSYNCALTYPNVEYYTGRPDPTPGSHVTITIPAGFLTDIYGNKSNEFVIGPFLFAYDFTEESIIGTYTISGNSIFGATYNEEDFTLTISASDDPEKGNVMISSYYGFEDTAIYGTFDTNTGKLTFPTNQIFGEEIYQEYYFIYYFYATDGKSFLNSLDLDVKQAGVLQSDALYIGYIYDYYALPASGNPADLTEDDYIDYDYNFFAIDTQRESAVAKAPVNRAKAKKAGKKPITLTRVK